MNIKAIGIADLKARLSSYLELVKAGREILIKDRGVIVAKLVPLSGPERQRSRRERLARSGVLKLGRGKPRPDVMSPPKGKMLGQAVLAALLDDRREGR